MSSSPIKRTPPELLAEIFRLCAPSEVVISTYTAPLVLTHVCNTWRAIALLDPALWSSFKVPIFLRQRNTHVALIPLWLDRSASQPLSLSVEVDTFPPLSAQLLLSVHDVIDVLAPSSARWKSLSLSLPGQHSLLPPLFLGGVPILKNLVLDLHAAGHKETDDINFILRSSPALTHFSFGDRPTWGSWDAPYEEIIITLLEAPWHRLTKLVVDNWIVLCNAYILLSQCTSLVECDLRKFAGGERIADYALLSPLLLPHLQSLTIYEHNLDDGLGCFFDLLICPSLRRCSVSLAFTQPGAWPHSNFDAFLARSSCSLERLFLEFTCMSEDQLIHCLQRTSSSLAYLEIYESQTEICITDKLLGMLTHSQQSHPLCPKLTTLVLHQSIECTDGMLATMLQSRQQPISPTMPLVHVEIKLSKTMARNTLDMQYLKKP